MGKKRNEGDKPVKEDLTQHIPSTELIIRQKIRTGKGTIETRDKVVAEGVRTLFVAFETVVMLQPVSQDELVSKIGVVTLGQPSMISHIIEVANIQRLTPEVFSSMMKHQSDMQRKAAGGIVVPGPGAASEFTGPK